MDATLSSTRIFAGESTVLEIIIETRGESTDAIDAPRLEPGLEVTSSHDFSELSLGYPGGRRRLIRRDFVLRAHHPGDYVIPPMKVVIDNAVYRTPSLSLFVEQRRSTPDGATANGRGTDEVMLRAWVEPDTVYVGQQVLLHAEALFPRDVRRSQSRPAAYEAPTPSDFWIQDLPQAVTSGVRSLNGVVFETQTFRRAYFPLTPGRFTLPPARLTYEVRRGFLYAPEGRELISDSIPLIVLPLPETGRPASFSGAVGRFNVEASIAPKEIDVGEAATLSIEISGNGNMKALPPPKLPEIRGLEIFPPTEDASVDATGDAVRGVKRFTWVLLPEDPGRIELPIEYGFFDPEQRRFAVARSEPLSLTVSGRGTVAAAAGDAAVTTLRPVALEPGGGTAWAPSRAFAFLQVIPLLAIFAGLVLRRNSEAIRSRRSRERLRRKREDTFAALHRFATSGESDTRFFGECTAAIRGAIADRLERAELAAASRDLLVSALRERGVADGTAAEVEALFTRIDRARFAHGHAGAKERAAVVADAGRVMDRVDRELSLAASGPGPTPSARGAARASLLVALLVPLGAIGNASPAAAQAPAVLFAQGVTAFHDARYADAVSAFSTYLDEAPRDANGWYNLGNAYVRDGQRGRAVWAWLRTIDLAPRHAGARHNIAATGAVEALAAAPPTLSLSAAEATIAFAVIWWLGGCVTAVLLATRARTATRAIIGTAGLATIVVALALPAVVRRPTAVAVEAHGSLLAGPARGSEQVASLSDGSTVTILERRGDWWRVREPRGREGWVEAGMFAEI